MRIYPTALLLLLLPLVAFGQGSAAAGNSPVGTWRTIDDKTGRVKSIVEIYDAGNGSLSGKVLRVLNSDKGPHPVCDACKGANHNKPIEGLVILWGMKPGSKGWEGGTILDPKNGKTYSARMTPVEGGAKLDVRGYLGFSLLGRSQTWIREQ